MRDVFSSFVFATALVAAPAACEARVQITVDLSSQTMNVVASGGSYAWPISSARDGFVTPRGTYGVQSLETMHYSKKYHNSPMPHSIFFNGGFAIHGTYDLANLGRPASHGCVRVSPANAATLYSLVQREGATIRIIGDASNAAYARAVEPEEAAPSAVSARPQRVASAAPTDNPLALIFGFGADPAPAAQPAQPVRTRAHR
ncbi:L,D-transpeptidase catalytic domain [Rhodoblastus acidophilus]|uniref:L,D-transpeptidase catalytic domain n=1 Tax=Rhodoblastus acidophilus TaxID=1074 RepID=A0A212R0R1_RHOAC|nr:L,D-transpeptidase [Rhodoblastus acidophilus]PPQ40439.1 L,D-transpeptidase [Rhodoblastus acidophilus]RAI23077.1 L,D-transpeptidase [Rhodoblastus acidophilus]SNB65575.1 L,D-transpeptidase catalytic domain [Rhodoblastus acidophilus]